MRSERILGVLGMSFNEWKEVKLEDVVDTISKRHKFDKDKIILINTSDVLEGKVLNHEYVQNENLKGQFKKSFQKNDILYSEIRPQNKRFAYVDFQSDDYVASTKLMVLRKKNEMITSNFLYQILKSDDLINELQVIAESRSGTFPQITYNELSRMKIKLPPLDEQKAIAHILSTLDDKIEVNNQINKTLENMAQAIFKQWFVDFEFPNEEGEPYKSSGGEMVESELGMIPKGWEVGKLDDIATIVMGQSPKGTSYNEVGEGEVFYQGRTDFSSRFPIRRLFTTEPKRMANDGDVLMSVRAPVGDLNVANERCCIGRGLSAISSSADLSSYILYVMHDLRERLNVYNGEGTVFGSINQKDLKSIKVISSCDNKTEIAFDDLIQPIDRMIRNNEDETRRLINLRDRLLPKLLSGEIRVPLDEEGDAS